jgi:hypothetical protein
LELAPRSRLIRASWRSACLTNDLVHGYVAAGELPGRHHPDQPRIVTDDVEHPRERLRQNAVLEVEP